MVKKKVNNYQKYHSKGQDYRTKRQAISYFTEWELTPQIKIVTRGSKVNSMQHADNSQHKRK